MNLNKINLLSFLMLVACTLLTQSASAYVVPVNNITKNQLQVTLWHPGWGDMTTNAIIEPNSGLRIDTANRCIQAVKISTLNSKEVQPIDFKVPNTGGGVACTNFNITVRQEGNKIVAE